MKKNYLLIALLLSAISVYTTYASETNTCPSTPPPPPSRPCSVKKFNSPRPTKTVLAAQATNKGYRFQSGSLRDVRAFQATAAALAAKQ